MWRVVRGCLRWVRTFSDGLFSLSVTPSRPDQLERVACQRRRVGVQGRRVRAAAREQLLHILRRRCTLSGTWERVGTYGRGRCGSNGLGTAHAWQGEVYYALGSCGAVAGGTVLGERPSILLPRVFTERPSGFNNNNNDFIGCIYRVRISGGTTGIKGGGAPGTGSQVPKAKVSLPRNAFGTPEGCGGAADVCIPSARKVLRCARSSAARPVRQCTGRPAGKQCGSDADAAPPASGEHARHARRREGHRRCAFRRPFHPSARRAAAHGRPRAYSNRCQDASRGGPGPAAAFQGLLEH